MPKVSWQLATNQGPAFFFGNTFSIRESSLLPSRHCRAVFHWVCWMSPAFSSDHLQLRSLFPFFPPPSLDIYREAKIPATFIPFFFGMMHGGKTFQPASALRTCTNQSVSASERTAPCRACPSPTAQAARPRSLDGRRPPRATEGRKRPRNNNPGTPPPHYHHSIGFRSRPVPGPRSPSPSRHRPWPDGPARARAKTVAT